MWSRRMDTDMKRAMKSKKERNGCMRECDGGQVLGRSGEFGRKHGYACAKGNGHGAALKMKGNCSFCSRLLPRQP